MFFHKLQSETTWEKGRPGWNRVTDASPGPWLCIPLGERELGDGAPEKLTNSSYRTVSWSHLMTSLEKEAGQARRDCTRENSGIYRIKIFSVSEA